MVIKKQVQAIQGVVDVYLFLPSLTTTEIQIAKSHYYVARRLRVNVKLVFTLRLAVYVCLHNVASLQMPISPWC